MGFPTDINSQAVRQIIRFVTGQDSDTGRVALAAYDVEGYILGKVFPGAAYVSDLAAALPSFELSQADPVLAPMISELAGLEIPWKDIITKLKDVLGPIALQLLLQLLSKQNIPIV